MIEYNNTLNEEEFSGVVGTEDGINWFGVINIHIRKYEIIDHFLWFGPQFCLVFTEN